MKKIDLHTHSIISYDGGITATQYEKLLKKGIVNAVAITDHNETQFARMMHERLGGQIIVGEEIMTRDGEIIGLFLQETILPGLSMQETVRAIKSQGGLVYLPHPFETKRKGIQMPTLKEIHKMVDIIEVYNARSFGRGKPMEAIQAAHEFDLAEAASSDAHGTSGVGRSYSIVSQLPTARSLPTLLREGSLQKHPAPAFTFWYPLLNKMKNKMVVTS